MKDKKMRPHYEAGHTHEGQHSQEHDGGQANNNESSTHESQRSERGREGGRDDRGRGGRHGNRYGRHGGGRGRAKRGEARYVFLDVLGDGPKHGYEIIKTLEERSTGQYVPSPGTVYPTLQYLEDQGLVSVVQDAERRVYQLTDAGKTEMEAQAEPIAAFWLRFTEQDKNTAAHPEIRFLEDELEHLDRIVWRGLRDATARDDQTLVRSVRQAVEACQTQVREIIAGKS